MKSLQTICLLFASAGLVAAQQYTITTVAGIPQVANVFPVVGDLTPTPATSGQLYQPTQIAVDSGKNFYIADNYTAIIRKITASTGNISILAGNGTIGYAGDGEAATNANIGAVHGIAADSSGNVYFSDPFNFRIRRVDAAGIITTYAGTNTRGYSGDGGLANAAQLWYPSAIALDGKGNLFFADYGNYTVRKITSAGMLSTVVGTGVWGNTGDGGPGNKATLASPSSLTFDAAGNLYIGDVGNNNIRKLDTAGNISTVATGIAPAGLGIDSAGNFYYVDGISSSVRKVLIGGGVVTIAGNGNPGYLDGGGIGSFAQVDQPNGLAMASDGSIYVADTGNDIIRRLVAVPNSVGVQDAASELPNAIAPGEILLLFGTGLGPQQFVEFTLTTNSAGTFFPTQIAGTTVTFNGTPAPLIYTSNGLVATIAPYEITGSATANIAVTYQGNTSTATTPVFTTNPALFTADTSGRGQAAALNQDLSANSAANPAKLGSTVVLYATGEGYTNAPVDGKVAGNSPPMPLSCIRAKIGNQIITPTYAGGVPTLVAGIMQINVPIPASVLPGSVLVQILADGCPSSAGYTSQAGVTIAVSK